MKKIVKIVLTGGPCAGKTTGMSWITNNFTKLGYKVFIVAETATELITGGAVPWEQINSLDFQIPLYKMLKEKEKTYEQLAESVDADKVLIVCDRGALDAEAYLSEEEIAEFHNKLNLSATQMMADYDAIFSLVTAANGAVEFYTTANNQARIETVEEAILKDNKTIEAWTGHPHLRVIDNSISFEKKMQKLVKEIAAFLGEPEPFEIERKFLIRFPDTKMLESLKNCQKVEILQTYLLSGDNNEIRLRQRGDGETFIFTKTTKRKVSEIKRVEVEKRLTESEYCKELMHSDTKLHQIRKTRYCLTYNHTYFEIDIYPFWKEYAIIEVELADENDTFEIPDFITVMREVTDDPNYKNYNLAKK